MKKQIEVAFAKWVNKDLRAQPMASKLISRENVIVILGAVMVVCLPLTICNGSCRAHLERAIHWEYRQRYNGRCFWLHAFSVAFFAAFVLRMAEERSRDS